MAFPNNCKAASELTPNLFELEICLYQEAQELLSDPDLAAVIEYGLNPLYGPLKQNPDLALITFQGGGGDQNIQTAAPSELLYLSDPYKFGKALRKYMVGAGLSSTLRDSTVAHAAVFPQAPTAHASKWVNPKHDARKRWVEFSRNWNSKLLKAQKPKAMVFFGEKASKAFSIEWGQTERNHAQNHLTFGRAEWNGIPAFFCHHLSIGCPEPEAIRCFERVREELQR